MPDEIRAYLDVLFPHDAKTESLIEAVIMALVLIGFGTYRGILGVSIMGVILFVYVGIVAGVKFVRGFADDMDAEP